MIAIDLLFLYNTAFDLILLAAVARITKRPILKARLAGAGAAGGLWSVICVMVSGAPGGGFGILRKGITYLLIPYVMCRIAFGERRKRCLECLLQFYLISMLFGGCLMLLRAAGIVLPGVTAMAAAGWLITMMAGKIRKRQLQDRSSCKALLIYGRQRVTVSAFWDSGNLLRTPEGLPVHILSRSTAQLIAGEHRLMGEPERSICYQTVGAGTAQMPIVMLQQIVLVTEKGNHVLSRPIVALSDVEFAKNSGHQLILHSDISV